MKSPKSDYTATPNYLKRRRKLFVAKTLFVDMLKRIKNNVCVLQLFSLKTHQAYQQINDSYELKAYTHYRKITMVIKTPNATTHYAHSTEKYTKC